MSSEKFFLFLGVPGWMINSIPIRYDIKYLLEEAREAILTAEGKKMLNEVRSK